MEKVDVCIIGSGPAGYTAAIYTGRANLKPLQFIGENFGGQLTTTTEVENFPGFPDGIDGYELVDRMKNQAEKWGTKMIEEDVIYVKFEKNNNLIKSKNKTVIAKTVIIATGAQAKKLEFENSNKFWMKGISACAVCDGALPMFRNNPLIVIGGGDSAMEEATFLSKFGSKIYVIVRKNYLRASKIMQDRVLKNDKIEIIFNSNVIGCYGEEKLNKVKIKSNDGEIKNILCNGLFFAIGHKPMTDIFKDQIILDDNGYIIVEKGNTKTNLDGVFACGDVQDKKWRQAITAAGSGCMAALQTENYLDNL